MGEDPSGCLRRGGEAPVPGLRSARRVLLDACYNILILSVLFVLSATVWVGSGVLIGWYIWGR